MKKLLSLLLLTSPVFAQNWQPITPQYAYRSNSPTISQLQNQQQTYQAPARKSTMGGGLLEAMFGDNKQQQVEPRQYAALTQQQQQAPLPYQQNLSFDEKFTPQMVRYDSNHGVGTIVIDTDTKFLYLVLGNGQAKRYGVGVGRPGFEWRGVKSVSRKAEWPDWTPPPQMLKRRPDLPRFMAGGQDNPMGARAMYLGSSLYRIHGTNEPHTIGHNVSSGCFRMRNDDIIDLYSRVRMGAKVVVL